jgi:uncharacterized repeat protein (TIGR03803 family)
MGTVFKVTTNGTLTILVSFNYANGAYPDAGLTLGNDGNFYGTTGEGGSNGYGTVFKVTTNGTLTTLGGFNFTSGWDPEAALTLGSDGNFYGTTYQGGITNSAYPYGMGTVFQVTTNGALTTLVALNFTNGVSPHCALTQGSDGNFYGTTCYGGTKGMGTVFKVTTNGALTTLVSFNSTNGACPWAGLMQGNDGNFYGTTGEGGSNGYGTVFKVTTNGTLTTLVGFNSNNGDEPEALTLGSDGNFYGTTADGGSSGYGTVFKVTTNGTLTTLVSFNFTNGWGPPALTLGNDANFYGTTYQGGSSGYGTVFRLLLPPFITIQPQSQTNNAGATVTFTIAATSLNALSYQWQKNGRNLFDGGNLSGTTNSTLTITGISDDDAASYSVIVSNANFSVTSSNATLTVIDPPIITSQPISRTNNAGSTATFIVTASGTTPAYQWFKGLLPISGAVLAALTLTNVQDADMAGYSVVLSNAAGSATSAPPATLTVIDPPFITSQPLSRTNNAGSTATFTLTASGTTPAYQWFKGSLPISGTVLPTLTLTNVQDADMAGYSVVLTNAAGSATSAPPATLTVIDPPIITVQPTNLLVLPGTNVVFGVSLTGSASYFHYQWQFNSANILNATNAIYTIASVGTNQGGNYSVVVTNAAGSAVSSNATLTVVLLPKSQTNNAGSTATFTVTAFGPGSLNYQWQKNGTNLVDGGNLSGATNSTLTIANVSDSDAANYLVMVSNAAGSVTSSIVTLTVIDPPVINSQPLSRTNNAGSTATFIVTASGTTPAYQWFKGSLPISGAVLAALTLTNVQAADMAGYTVVLTNAAGSATSAPPATLTVIDPPFITTQPLSRTNNAGSTATFTLTASGTTPAYQWFKGSLPISGAVLPTLALTNVQDADMAGYSVVLTNAAGSATSAPPATLTVIDPPMIMAQPSSLVVLPGTNAAFGVSLTGSAPFFRYQWKFNGTNILNATSASYAIPSVGTNHAGNYSVVVTNAAGVAVSSNAALNVVLSPKSQTNYASSTATLTVTTFGPESLNWQWQKNGTNLVNGGNLSGATNSTLTIASVSDADADAAIYSAVVSDATGSVTTSNAVLTVNDSLFIASQPQSQTVGLGSNVAFNVTAYGAPPFVFQWYFNGKTLGSPATGTNFSSCALTNVGASQAGNYSVVVFNGYGSLMSSNAVLTVQVFPPIIGLQPSSQSVMMGSSASFSVSVSGTVPLYYQWRFNGTSLLNATNAAYAIQAVAATNTGSYSVVVTNLAGSVTSSNAFLTVIVPPTLALQLWAGFPLLDLNGMLSSNFVVQYSTNLAGTNWMNLLSLSNLPASPYLFLDPAGDGEPARFYRAFMW